MQITTELLLGILGCFGVVIALLYRALKPAIDVSKKLDSIDKILKDVDQLSQRIKDIDTLERHQRESYNILKVVAECNVYLLQNRIYGNNEEELKKSLTKMIKLIGD